MSPFVSTRCLAIASAGLAVLAACSQTMEAPVPQSITVTPSSLSFSSKGATQQLPATVMDQHGNTIQNATVTWSSNNASVATVTSGGLATSVGNGTTQIVAAAGVVTTTVTVTVAQVAASITVTPPSFSFSSKGATQQLTATVMDQNGNTIQNATVTWSSNNTAVATVTSGGLAASVGNGTTQLVVAAGEGSTQGAVTVAPAG